MQEVDRSPKDPSLKVIKFSHGNKYLMTGGTDGTARLFAL